MHKLSAQRPFPYMSAHKSEQQPNNWMKNDFCPRLLDESREENAQLHLFGKFCRREQKKLCIIKISCLHSSEHKSIIWFFLHEHATLKCMLLLSGLDPLLYEAEAFYFRGL